MIDNTDDIDINNEENKENQESEGKDRKKKSALLLLFQILVTGTTGWKELRRSRIKPEQAAAGCFYPILALTSACKFADWFYLPEFDIATTVVSAVSIFASFFFSYFAIGAICRLLFPESAKEKTDSPYFKLMVQYSLSSLAIFLIPSEIFPIIDPITVFLPIWTAFIITKGVRFLRLPEQYQNRCMVTIVVTVIVMPYFFMWACEKIL